MDHMDIDYCRKKFIDHVKLFKHMDAYSTDDENKR